MLHCVSFESWNSGQKANCHYSKSRFYLKKTWFQSLWKCVDNPEIRSKDLLTQTIGNWWHKSQAQIMTWVRIFIFTIYLHLQLFNGKLVSEIIFLNLSIYGKILFTNCFRCLFKNNKPFESDMKDTIATFEENFFSLCDVYLITIFFCCVCICFHASPKFKKFLTMNERFLEK